MLFINNPEARNAIIESIREDNGQHAVTVDEVATPTVDTPRSRPRRSLGFLRRPVATG